VRDLVADAAAVRLTNNPKALARALRHLVGSARSAQRLRTGAPAFLVDQFWVLSGRLYQRYLRRNTAWSSSDEIRAEMEVRAGRIERAANGDWSQFGVRPWKKALKALRSAPGLEAAEIQSDETTTTASPPPRPPGKLLRLSESGLASDVVEALQWMQLKHVEVIDFGNGPLHGGLIHLSGTTFGRNRRSASSRDVVIGTLPRPVPTSMFVTPWMPKFLASLASGIVIKGVRFEDPRLGRAWAAYVPNSSGAAAVTADPTLLPALIATTPDYVVKQLGAPSVERRPSALDAGTIVFHGERVYVAFQPGTVLSKDQHGRRVVISSLEAAETHAATLVELLSAPDRRQQPT
jgi:hypothetical protein